MSEGVWEGKQAGQDKGHVQAVGWVYGLHSPLESHLLVWQKPCQSLSIGATRPPKCLIPSPLVSRLSDLSPLPCPTMEHHPPEQQVPAEKLGFRKLGREKLSGCVEQTARGWEWALEATGH